MKESKRLNPFGRFCCTIGNLPTSYMLSLTYEEQLIWLCKYLEETVIPAVNNNAEALEELQNLFIELKTYVDEYFENLDIQTEINNKLDEMADDGTLEEIIAQYLELQGVLAYDTVDDMKTATNLVNGSFTKTYGYETLNDGEGSYYKVRTILNTDVIDNKNIIALSDETLVAVRMIDNELVCFNSVSDMINAGNIVNGNYVRTYGYYSSGDGGSALYKIRLRTVEDTPDGATIIALNDLLLVAELIVDNKLNVKQFGAKGDGVNDDTEAIQKAINLLRVTPRTEKDYSELYFPDGNYLVTDTLTIDNCRHSKIYGKCTITANINKPIIEITSSMWLYIDDLIIEQQNAGSDSSCLKIRNSYILKINEIFAKGGDKGVDVVGNNITFDGCSFRNARINFYTQSQGNNTQNTLINCSIEGATDYNLYFGWLTSFYGLWVVQNCYIEGNATSQFYLKNGIRLFVKNCYINQTGQNSCFTFDGTIPRLHMYITGCQINSSGYVYREIGQNRTICAYVGDNDITGTLYNTNDSYTPSIVNITPTKLNIYNLTWLKEVNNSIDGWLGTGSYTLQETVSEESINALSISSGYIYKQFYLNKDVTYKIEVYIKSDGTSNAQLDIYNYQLSSRKLRIETDNTEFSKITQYFRVTENAKYNLLLRAGGTYCGINIYSLMPDEN